MGNWRPEPVDALFEELQTAEREKRFLELDLAVKRDVISALEKRLFDLERELNHERFETRKTLLEQHRDSSQKNRESDA